MFRTLQRVMYQVPDLAQARQWYRTVLEKEPAVDTPFFVGFVVGNAMLGLVRGAEPPPGADGRVIACWGVEDADAAYRRLLDCGATVHTELHTVGPTRTASVIDPFGNVIGITSTPADLQKQSVEEQPSESAMAVAVCRALVARNEPPGRRGRDGLAEIFLSEDRRRILVDPASREYVIRKIVTPESYHYVLARTAYMDEVFEESLASNVPQIVLLGAGFDSRSYRFRERIEDTRIFELDIRPTQERKRNLLDRSNVPIPEQLTFVSINFRTEKIEDALSAVGFDRNARTLFLWEGVMYYLAAATVDTTLDSIRRSSPAGSAICFDYMTQRVESVYAGEPFQFWIDEGQMPAFLRARGYALVEHLGPEDIEERYLTLGDGSSLGKTRACFNLARASVLDGTRAEGMSTPSEVRGNQ